MHHYGDHTLIPVFTVMLTMFSAIFALMLIGGFAREVLEIEENKIVKWAARYLVLFPITLPLFSLFIPLFVLFILFQLIKIVFGKRNDRTI